MEKCVNTVRFLSNDMINEANSGHPGIALGAAPIITNLYLNHLTATPKNSLWVNRDRFVLAAGHGSSMLYSTLHLCGYKLTIEDLKQFRQLGSLTPGHPEFLHTDGVDATSGPLGQGIAMSIGMAISENFLRNKYNKPGFDIFNHYVYCLCGDGDLQEGVTLEALSLAGHLKLGKLIILYDSNDIQLDGQVSLTNSENVKMKFESMNFHYQKVEDGTSFYDLDVAIKNAQSVLDKPSIIEVKTLIGYKSHLENTNKSHGAPLGKENRVVLENNLNYFNKPFEVDEEVYTTYKESFNKRGDKAYKNWKKVFKQYKEAYPEEGNMLESLINGTFQFDFSQVSQFDNVNDATRNVSGKILSDISKQCPTFFAGSADLASSCKVKGNDGNYTYENPTGRNINFGVREHAMGAISNGISLYGVTKACCGGFFVFSDYLKPSMRMAALMNIDTLFVFSHDSVCVGEDGPTHQPIEQLSGLRLIPNMNVFRPASANETRACYEYVLKNHGANTILLTRQNVKEFTSYSYENVSKGAYIASEEKGKLDGILIATGSEVNLCIDVQRELEKEGIFVRVVSMPCTSLFDKQKNSYKNKVLPKSVRKTVFVELGSTMPLYKYAKHVYGVDSFGVSAKASDVLKALKFTVNDLKDYYKNLK